MSTIEENKATNTISSNEDTGKNIERKFQNKIMSKVYFVSFIVLFISSSAMVFASAIEKTEEFWWIGVVMFIAALPIIQWAFALFWKQEKNRKARNKAARLARKNGSSGQ